MLCILFGSNDVEKPPIWFAPNGFILDGNSDMGLLETLEDVLELVPNGFMFNGFPDCMGLPAGFPWLENPEVLC